MAFQRGSVNKVMLVGRAGADPEVRSLPSGDSVVNLSLATTSGWRDKQTNENKERTEWHRLVFFGRIADTVSQYVRKGSMLYVEGSLRTNEWEKDGIKRYTTEIVADQMTMLGSRDGRGGAPSSEAPAQGGRSAPGPARQSASAPAGAAATGATGASAPPEDDLEDDIPF
jgi:single-strand DNA-binding protein